MLGYHVIFHWNRLELSMRGQSILAWTARVAILHGEEGEESTQGEGLAKSIDDG
ncbi:hypothetical protein [Streptomyces sp. NPDC059611]|uniref:hypothetical protein n=1 Tax=Streptomyces sp. NPDC059611 TaxID=3346884 RepID=UPI003695501F